MRIGRIDPTNRDLRETVNALVAAVNSLLPEGELVKPPEDTIEPPWESEGRSKEHYLTFPTWQPRQEYEEGQIVFYDDDLYEVIQAHTSQEDWTPPDVPALFKAKTEPGEIGAWVQPDGAHDAYMSGDQVEHNDTIWTSIIDDNVWEPGVHGWTAE